MILCIEMRLQIIKNFNKLTEKVQFLMYLYLFLCAIHIIADRAYNNYNINPYKILFKIFLCILMILYVEK
jgi:hypothetical protein